MKLRGRVGINSGKKPKVLDLRRGFDGLSRVMSFAISGESKREAVGGEGGGEHSGEYLKVDKKKITQIRTRGNWGGGTTSKGSTRRLRTLLVQ